VQLNRVRAWWLTLSYDEEASPVQIATRCASRGYWMWDINFVTTSTGKHHGPSNKAFRARAISGIAPAPQEGQIARVLQKKGAELPPPAVAPGSVADPACQARNQPWCTTVLVEKEHQGVQSLRRIANGIRRVR